MRVCDRLLNHCTNLKSHHAGRNDRNRFKHLDSTNVLRETVWISFVLFEVLNETAPGLSAKLTTGQAQKPINDANTLKIAPISIDETEGLIFELIVSFKAPQNPDLGDYNSLQAIPEAKVEAACQTRSSRSYLRQLQGTWKERLRQLTRRRS